MNLFGNLAKPVFRAADVLPRLPPLAKIPNFQILRELIIPPAMFRYSSFFLALADKSFNGFSNRALGHLQIDAVNRSLRKTIPSIGFEL